MSIVAKALFDEKLKELSILTSNLRTKQNKWGDKLNEARLQQTRDMILILVSEIMQEIWGDND